MPRFICQTKCQATLPPNQFPDLYDVGQEVTVPDGFKHPHFVPLDKYEPPDPPIAKQQGRTQQYPSAVSPKAPKVKKAEGEKEWT